jgi:hypothetical protein
MKVTIERVEPKTSAKGTKYFGVKVSGREDILYGFDTKLEGLVSQEVEATITQADNYSRIDLVKEAAPAPPEKSVVQQVEPPSSLPADVYVRMHALDIATRIRDMADVPAEKVGSDRLLYIADKMYNYIKQTK